MEVQFDSEPLTVQWSRYPSGRLALALVDAGGLPVAQLSLDVGGADLAANEFVLKHYSENRLILNQLVNAGVIWPTERAVQVGPHCCPVCIVPRHEKVPRV